MLNTKEEYIRLAHDVIRQRNDEPLRIAEVGVGVGGTALAIASVLSRQHHLTAIDIEEANLNRLRSALREQSPELQTAFVHADICELPPDAGWYDLVFSDTTINLLGARLPRAFRAIYDRIRPGGSFCFRELLPPSNQVRTKRDLFFRTLGAACELNATDYRMHPIEAVESALSIVGFERISIKRVERTPTTPFDLTQWHPLASPACPLRKVFIAHFREQSESLTDGIDLASSYHILCYKPESGSN